MVTFSRETHLSVLSEGVPSSSGSQDLFGLLPGVPVPEKEEAMNRILDPKTGRKRLDLSGQPFGRWTVLECSGRACSQTTWRCRCQCGNEKEAVLYAHLVGGRSRSCGCLRAEEKLERKENPRPPAQWVRGAKEKRVTHYPWLGDIWTLEQIAKLEGLRLLPFRNKVRNMGMTVEEAVRDCRERGLVVKPAKERTSFASRLIGPP